MDYSKFIAVTNRSLCKGDFLNQIEKVAGLGPAEIILREKDLDEREYEELAAQVLEICHDASVPLVIHGHPAVARRLGCRRVHLSIPVLQDYASLNELEGLEVSVSCHSTEDVELAEQLGATRIVLGTIFETECKKGLKGRGLGFLSEVVRSTSLPVFAIGGIKPENIESILETGAAGGCMMSWFMTV